MWPSTESKPRPIVTTETWVPPASRQASISAGEVAYAAARKRHIVRAEVVDRPAEAAHAIAQPVPGVDAVVDAATEKMKPSASRAARSNAASPDPPSQIGMDRAGFGTSAARSTRSKRPEKSTTGSVNKPAKQLDLLLLPGAAGTEVLPEGLVLDVVPADPHAETQPTAGQEIDIGRLPCHERGLALRKDQDPGGETDSLGDAGQIGEHHERVVERVVLGVGARQRRRSIGVNGTEHVVVGEEVVEAQVLDRSPDPPNRGRISSKLGLRVDDADLHGVLDLVGAFADLEHLRIAVEAGHRRLEHVAEAAVDLDGLRCRRYREATGLQLRHRRFLEEGLPGVAQVRGAIREPPCRLELGRDVGELELDRLELRDGLAELHALPGVVRRHVEHGLGQAERQGRDRDAPDLERAQELAEPHRRIADEVIVGDPDVVEEQLAGVETPPADAAHLRAHGEAGGVLLHDEARERRPLPLARLGAGQQRHPERHVGAGVGDERLPTVDQPATVAPYRPGADAARVRARIGLGQTERAEDASLGQRSQPTLSLRVVAEEVQRQRADRHVRLPRGGHRLVGQADLLHRGDEADGRHADAAPLLGDQHAEQAQRTHLAEQVGRAPRLVPRRGGTRGDLLLRELATQADQIAFRLGEREVHGPILLDRPVQRLLVLIRDRLRRDRLLPGRRAHRRPVPVLRLAARAVPGAGASGTTT